MLNNEEKNYSFKTDTALINQISNPGWAKESGKYKNETEWSFEDYHVTTEQAIEWVQQGLKDIDNIEIDVEDVKRKLLSKNTD